MEFPPTIIVVHPRENRAKCSVEPLRSRDGFLFWKHPQRGAESLDGYVRLGIGGEPLAPADRSLGLFVIDGTWKLAAEMEKAYADLPIRSLHPWVTAYPRVSKIFNDPTAGLATIEAIYAAYHQMSRSTEGLLNAYYWKDQFLTKNADQLASIPPTP
jgi:pre-rRNA-processing protein TSR3